MVGEGAVGGGVGGLVVTASGKGIPVESLESSLCETTIAGNQYKKYLHFLEWNKCNENCPMKETDLT